MVRDVLRYQVFIIFPLSRHRAAAVSATLCHRVSSGRTRLVGMDRKQSHLYLVFIAVLLGEEKMRTSQVMLSDCLPSALTSLPLNDLDVVSSPLIAMFETLASDKTSRAHLVVVIHSLQVPSLHPDRPSREFLLLHSRLFRQRPTPRLIIAYLASREASMKGLTLP
jgi:hypothetical protein